MCSQKLIHYAPQLKPLIKSNVLPRSACHLINICVSGRDYFTIGPHSIPEEDSLEGEAPLFDGDCAICTVRPSPLWPLIRLGGHDLGLLEDF
jgi:hypothetical protein